MSLPLPYNQPLDLSIDDTVFKGFASIEFTEDNSGASATVKVYVDTTRLELIIDKTEKIHPVADSQTSGLQYFQFVLRDTNSKKRARDAAGYIPGTYKFSFTPSPDPPISGLLVDPHKHAGPDNDVDWTAENPRPEEADAKSVSGGA